MYGLFAAFGPAAGRLNKTDFLARWNLPPLCAATSSYEDDQVWLFVSRAPGVPGAAVQSSADGSVTVALDGQIYVEGVPAGVGLAEHLAAFCQVVASRGMPEALGNLLGACCNLVVIDRQRGQIVVANDCMASLTLYYAEAPEGGALVSSRPAAISETGLIGTEPDMMAVAEWLHFGQPLGDRHALRAIRVLPPGSLLRWQPQTQRMLCERGPNIFSDVPFRTPGPSTDELAEAFRASCQRVYSLGAKYAQLQSAGLDSRLILAAWPEARIPCYTYGRPESLEVDIARRLAAVKGSPFHHVAVDGDAIASALEVMFRISGQATFGPRLVAAQRIYEDGYDCVLDGWTGGLLLGGTFFRIPGLLPRRTVLAGLLMRHLEHRASEFSLDRIAEALFRDMATPRQLALYTTPDFVREVEAQRPAILDDIVTLLRELRPADDSLSALVRNFKIQNRSARFVNQQGIVVRAYVQVAYPFTWDREFLALSLSAPPEPTVFRRHQLVLYRKHFPAFARVISGHSLLPLTYPAFLHRLWGHVLNKFDAADWYARFVHRRTRKWETWPQWLRESRRLRDILVEDLTSAGISETNLLEATLRRNMAGEDTGTGVIYHLLPIARWLRVKPQHSGR